MDGQPSSHIAQQHLFDLYIRQFSLQVQRTKKTKDTIIMMDFLWFHDDDDEKLGKELGKEVVLLFYTVASFTGVLLCFSFLCYYLFVLGDYS